jgi:hypothetical protein
MNRTLTVWLMLLLVVAQANATLVVAIPTADGVIVAADSRAIINGQSCDDWFKIVEAKSPLHTVITVTGTRTFFPFQTWTGKEDCKFFRSVRPLYDIPTLVKAYVESNDIETIRSNLEDLGEKLAQVLRVYQAYDPN